MAIAEVTNAAVSFLTSSLSDSGFYQGILGNAVYDATKSMGGLTGSLISKIIRQRLQEEEQTGKVPLNHDLRRAIRFAYLRAACNVIEEKKSQLSQHGKTLEHIIATFSNEKERVYQDLYVAESGINIPNIAYGDAHKIHPAYQGDKDQLSEEVEGDLRREIRQRFEVDDYRDGVKELLKHLAHTSLFSQLQNNFLQEYKDRKLIQASFDGAVLVQLASRSEVEELETLKALPEETQQRVQSLLQELHSQIAEQNQELGKVLKDYFDERSTIILIQLKQVEKKVDATFEQTVITNERLEQLQADIQKLREKQSERDAKRRLERQRIAGELLTLVAFTGRSDKLSELHESIYGKKIRLSQICGPVGRGKTALATKFVQNDKTFDSILFCSLRSQNLGTIDPIISLLESSLPEDKANQLTNLWKDQKDIPSNITATLRNIIGGHRTLIVIDNIEDVLSDGNFKSEYETLALFMQKVCALEGHSCQLLVTSREPVDLTTLGRDLGGKHSSQVISLDQGLSTEQGIALLRKLGDEASGLKTAPDETLGSLTEQLEGIPMVLSNLAGLLRRGRGMSISRFLSNPSKLQELKDEPARVLYESLTPDEQRVMQALAIYGKAVPDLAVRYLLPDLDTNSILYELENNYAVQLTNTEPITYSLRPLDQAYVYNEMRKDMRITQHEQAASYYHEIRKPKEKWEQVEDLQPSLDEFEQLIKMEGYDAACSVLMEIEYDYLRLWGYVVQARDLHLRLAGKVQDPQLKSYHLGNLGLAYKFLGEIRKAIQCYEQSLEISREINNRRGESSNLGNLGNAYYSLGEIRKSIDYHEQALKISRELSDRWYDSNHLGNIGNAYYSLDEFRKAIEYYEQVLVISKEVKNRRSESNVLGNLANAYSDLGEHGKAIEYYEKSLVICREINNRVGEGTTLINLGAVYSELGEVRKAIEYYEKSLTISREINNPSVEAVCLWHLGFDYSNLKESRKALACYIVSYDIMKRIESPQKERLLSTIKTLQNSEPNFESLLQSLIPTGDVILNEATSQNYTFFRDAPPDFPDQILKTIETLDQNK